MKLASYLGEHVSKLLESGPFASWVVTRSMESDLPRKEIWYEFTDQGIEVICDEDERIRTIFLHNGVDEALTEIPFAYTRRQVLERFGVPAKSGQPTTHPILGTAGAWDRFSRPSMTLHIQYRSDSDSIDMITLVRPDAVP